MSKRILVAYDTVNGSTAELAEFVGKELKKEGNTVDVCRVTEVTDIEKYQAIVAGSPIIREKWTEDSLDFLKRHKSALSHKPVAIFYTCLAILGRKLHD